MKKTFILFAILLASFELRAQEPLPGGLSQEKIISLMTSYHKMVCKWVDYEVPKGKGNSTSTVYVKEIEIIPLDTSEIKLITFKSGECTKMSEADIISKNKDTTKFEVTFAQINGEIINFIIPDDNEYTVVEKFRHQYPKMEAKMTALLKNTPEGTKTQSWKKKK